MTAQALPQSRPGAGGRSLAPGRLHPDHTARHGLILAAALVTAALAVGLTATTPGGRGVGVGLALAGGLVAVRVAWVKGWDQ